MQIRMPRFLPFVVLLTSACVYRQDIPQGNFYKADDVAKLEEGMTREQVQFVMGTPMIADPFHPDRWDYVFYVDAKDAARDYYRRITVFFEGDSVVRIEKEGIADDVVPTGDEGIVTEEKDEVPNEEQAVILEE